MHQLLGSAERRNELLKPQEKLKKPMHGYRETETERYSSNSSSRF
jgi:hypothetical protein